MTLTAEMSVGAETAAPRKPFWGKCEPCGHCWAIAYLPMTVETFARVAKGSKCPMCGSGKIFVAKQYDGELQEAQPQ
jgi:hypothetical protein